MSRIKVGDEVRLAGYRTVGRVTGEEQRPGVRLLTVAWYPGGFHTAPEEGWRLVSEEPLVSKEQMAWALGLLPLLVVVVFLVTLAIVT